MISQCHRSFLLKIALFTWLSLSLSACGFHLKETKDGLSTKFPQIYVQSSDPYGDLNRLVKIRLRGAGVEVLDSPRKDVAILTLNTEKRSARMISLNVKALNAEQEVGFVLKYSIQIPGYQPLPFSFNLYRDFLDNPAQALAKSRESEQLTEELRETAADNIIYTLQALNLDRAKKLIQKKPQQETSINGTAQ